MKRRNRNAGWWQGEDGGVLNASAVGETAVSFSTGENKQVQEVL